MPKRIINKNTAFRSFSGSIEDLYDYINTLRRRLVEEKAKDYYGGDADFSLMSRLEKEIEYYTRMADKFVNSAGGVFGTCDEFDIYDLQNLNFPDYDQYAKDKESEYFPKKTLADYIPTRDQLMRLLGIRGDYTGTVYGSREQIEAHKKWLEERGITEEYLRSIGKIKGSPGDGPVQNPEGGGMLEGEEERDIPQRYDDLPEVVTDASGQDASTMGLDIDTKTFLIIGGIGLAGYFIYKKFL